MERILKRAILDHLTSSNLISPAQHGFLPNRSCLTNMLVFMDSLTQAKDEELISDAKASDDKDSNTVKSPIRGHPTAKHTREESPVSLSRRHYRSSDEDELRHRREIRSSK
ncbi:hypothetical protein T265_04026 [Opisthorchis viverrini]|uniref:Reverse transcriptase domain-containing protein n=1 Tax=Opisthorchis viverrini TaxID=6198 RepID=A0A075AH54_OPIVI|nr:hypothetical protein T265_04026 [Opisthorchis viverrini]KER29374.1 hypothetical protein T265_04026 [Opisthorchis viverrini]